MRLSNLLGLVVVALPAMLRIRITDADPDPAFLFDADPDPVFY
jgi:hypothetical protein